MSKSIGWSTSEVIGISIPNLDATVVPALKDNRADQRWVVKAGGVLSAVSDDYVLQEFEYTVELTPGGKQRLKERLALVTP